MARTKREVFDLIASRAYKHGIATVPDGKIVPDWEKVCADIANHLKLDDRAARYVVREYIDRWGHYHA